MDQPQAVATPMLIKILSIFLLFGGLAWLALAIGGFLLIGPLALVIGIYGVISALILIPVSFGLRKMKLWALYGYTIWAVLGIVNAIYTFVNTPASATQTTNSPMNLLVIVLSVLVLVYLWMNKKNFR